MKTIFQIFIFLLLSSVINSTIGQRLNGKVKSYRDTYYSVYDKFGKIKKGPKLNDSIYYDESVSFDQNGNIIQLIEYHTDGTVHSIFKGRSGFENNNIESIYVRLNPDIIIEQKPFIIESLRYSWGEKYEMKYQNNIYGLPVEETIFDLFGRELFKITFKRDEKGNSVEDIFSDGTVNQYKYDTKGNRTEWVFRSSNRYVIITTYKYDLSGNLIEMNVNNSYKSTFKYHYDNFTYKYLFDDQGNWIERIDYENDEPLRIVERMIEYSS